MPRLLRHVLFSRASHGCRFIRRPLILLLLVLLLTACDPNFPWVGPGTQYPGWTLPPVDTTISAPKEPPAPQAETEAPLPQGPAGYFVWDPGHWHWTGQDFVWIDGHYVERPYRGSTWVPGLWAPDKSKTEWIWTPGHWR